MPQPIAIACSDLHLSLTAPLARSGEPDWQQAMASTLYQIKHLADELEAPILCCGDVFNVHNPPPELVNFAIAHLPKMIAIPGQHDLPLHNADDICKSAYHTLELCNILVGRDGWMALDSGAFVYFFPWGKPITPPLEAHRKSKSLKIALVHEYTWIPGASYPDAPISQQATKEKYEGYDVVLIGDNHIPWQTRLGKTGIFNCGGLMRRRSDDLWNPRIGIVMSDGSVESREMDTSEDVFEPTASIDQKTKVEFSEFISHLKGLRAVTLDFAETVKRAMDVKGVTPAVRQYVLEALGLAGE